MRPSSGSFVPRVIFASSSARRIHPARVAVRAPQQHRAIVVDRVELQAVRLEAGGIHVGDDQPLRVPVVLEAGADARRGLLDGELVVAEAAAAARQRALGRVDVAVDEAGQHGVPAGADHAGLRADEGLDRGGVADRDDAAVIHGERARDGCAGSIVRMSASRITRSASFAAGGGGAGEPQAASRGLTGRRRVLIRADLITVPGRETGKTLVCLGAFQRGFPVAPAPRSRPGDSHPPRRASADARWRP